MPADTPAPSPAELAALAHLQRAEAAVMDTPEARVAQPRPIQSVGVIGGGTMGAGIAVALLSAGLPVVMVERDDAALALRIDMLDHG